MGRKKKKYTAELSKRAQTRKTNFRDRDSLKSKVLKPEILLIGVFILALFIRLVYLNQVISTPIFNGLAADAEKYESFALQILKGDFTNKDFIYLNPFYPFFLALIYLIFGYSNLPVVFIQGIIDSISCIIIYYIASLLFNKKAAILAALIYACYGIAIFYTGILLAPTVVIFFTLLFIASLLVAQEKRQLIIFFISGILFGLAVLARPNVSLFLFLLPLWFFTVLKNKLGIHKSIQGFLLLLVGFFMVTSLITIRNYSIEKRFSPSALGGINFYIGNNPQAKGCFMSPHGIAISPIEEIKSSIQYAEKESGKRLTPSQASRYWLLKGLKFIKDNPLDALFLYMKKFALFWRKEEISLNINYPLSKTLAPIFRLPFISFGFIAPFAILGIILSIKRKNSILLVTLFMFSYMVSVIIFFVSARYRLPIAPFLIICSSYTFYRFGEMIRAKEVKGITTFGALFILLFVGINNNFVYLKVASTLHYYNLGVIYNKKGRLDEAISEFKRSIKIKPNFADAYSNLGNAYFKKGRLDEAISEFKKAININPNLAMAHYSLGVVYGKKGMLDEAISEFKKTISLDPNNALAHYKLGFAYKIKGLLEETIYEYKKALKINPNLAEVHYDLGVAYDNKGMLDEAIPEYKKALDINPNLAEVHYSLGNAYVKKGRLDEAISEYKRTLALNASLAEVHNNLGVAYEKKGRLDEAIPEYKKALTINPNLAEAHYSLANAYVKKGRLDEAISAYRETTRLKPDYPLAYNNLAWIYATSPKAIMRNGDEAVALAIKACELTGFKKAEALNTLAAAYAETGNFEKAIEYQNRAIDLSQKEARPSLLKLLELYQSGQAYRSQ